jgi:hypothetical protein
MRGVWDECERRAYQMTKWPSAVELFGSQMETPFVRWSGVDWGHKGYGFAA